VVAVAGDAGGAAAVGPVIEALSRDARIEVVTFAYRHAAVAWAPRKIAFETLDEGVDETAVEAVLRRRRAVALLTATSVNGVDLERLFTRVARRLALPSVAVLDMWSSYSARFGATSGAGPDVPDRIAVMDARARDAMLKEGFVADQLVITGHPGFDDVVEARRAFTAADRRRVRALLGAGDEECLVVFASQALAEAWGADVSQDGHAGYTERTVLESLAHSLERVAPSFGRPVTLVVRPHPREATPIFAPTSRTYRLLLRREGTPREAAMAADAVLGMCSILLVESALLGIPTVSIQPGLRIPDALPVVPGLARVYRDQDLDTALRAALAPRDEKPFSAPHPDEGAFAIEGRAAERVVTLIKGLLALSRSSDAGRERSPS
jgi:hypothetical protein